MDFSRKLSRNTPRPKKKVSRRQAALQKSSKRKELMQERRNLQLQAGERAEDFIPWEWSFPRLLVDSHNIPVLTIVRYDLDAFRQYFCPCLHPLITKDNTLSWATLNFEEQWFSLCSKNVNVCAMLSQTSSAFERTRLLCLIVLHGDEKTILALLEDFSEAREQLCFVLWMCLVVCGVRRDSYRGGIYLDQPLEFIARSLHAGAVYGLTLCQKQNDTLQHRIISDPALVASWTKGVLEHVSESLRSIDIDIPGEIVSLIAEFSCTKLCLCLPDRDPYFNIAWEIIVSGRTRFDHWDHDWHALGPDAGRIFGSEVWPGKYSLDSRCDCCYEYSDM